MLTLFYVWQGVPQNLSGYVEATTLEGAKQTIAQGPVASQLAIKMLGTNGGGFFNANSAHPYENPTALSNFVQMLTIFVIGAALTNVFGRMVGDERQGWAILAAMGVLFLVGVYVAYWAEAGGNPLIAALGVDNAAGNMEGKEVRFGIANSALFAMITTAASCGAVNAMHDSFMPLGGMVPLFNILLGEIIFGGVGAGLYGMLLFAILAVFIAGLMVGRTPEYVGKKIEAREVKMTHARHPDPAALHPGLQRRRHGGRRRPRRPGQRRARTASARSSMPTRRPPATTARAFAGLTANTLFYNTTIGLAMFVGRFLMIVPMVAIAGSLAAKKIVPASAGTFPTNGPLFVGLLVGVILIVGGLTFLPALALGPLVEHFAMLAGTLY